jgi:hypothetical protein
MEGQLLETTILTPTHCIFVFMNTTSPWLSIILQASCDLPLVRRAELRPLLAESPRVDEESNADVVGQEIVHAHNAIHLATKNTVDLRFLLAKVAHLLTPRS